MRLHLPTRNELLDAATALVRRLVDAGHEAYFAGGAVRDLAMGIQPEDVDIATSATPEEVMSLFSRHVPVGAAFGVVLVLFRGFEFQVATFRTEGGYRDGRHPDEVRFSSAREDVLRRDFTINGLLYDPIREELLDWVGGLEDIRRGLVRTIGDPYERFSEDHLRLIRAVRFAARFDFRIHEETWSALRARASDIRTVSRERIRDELTKMFVGPRPHRALELLAHSGLLEQVLPEVAALRGVAQPARYHPEGDVFEHVLAMLRHMDRIHRRESGRKPPLELAWAVVLHDVGKPTTATTRDGQPTFPGHSRVGARLADRILRELRFSNRERRNIVALVADHMRLQDFWKARPATRKRLMREPHFPLLLELFRLEELSKERGEGAWQRIREAWQATPPEELAPPRLVTGRDLIQLGFRPGPRFKEVLQAVEEAQLNGEVVSRDEALELARRLLTDDSGQARPQDRGNGSAPERS